MRRPYFILTVLVLLIAASPALAESPKVVINEIMYNPADNNRDRSGEWIELYNPNEIPINLSGWNIEYDGHSEYTFPPTAVIPGGGYMVVSRNTSWFQRTYGSGTVGDDLFGNLSSYTFSNSGTHWIALIADNGSVIDNVTYTGGSCSENYSIERKDPLGSSDATDVGDTSNWACSQKNGGTPLEKNTVYVPFFESRGVIGILLLIMPIIILRKK